MEKAKTLKGAAASATKMISVEEANEQMKALMTQANQRMQQLAIQVQNLDSMLRDKTIENLFKVLEYSHNFSSDFVTECVNVLEKYLAKIAFETPEESEKEKDTTDKVNDVVETEGK